MKSLSALHLSDQKCNKLIGLPGGCVFKEGSITEKAKGLNNSKCKEGIRDQRLAIREKIVTIFATSLLIHSITQSLNHSILLISHSVIQSIKQSGSPKDHDFPGFGVLPVE